MNIHEYQGKAVLKSFGAPVLEGRPALSVEEAVAAVLAEGTVRTPDLGGKSSTEEVASAVLEKLS